MKVIFKTLAVIRENVSFEKMGEKSLKEEERLLVEKDRAKKERLIDAIKKRDEELGSFLVNAVDSGKAVEFKTFKGKPYLV